MAEVRDVHSNFFYFFKNLNLMLSIMVHDGTCLTGMYAHFGFKNAFKSIGVCVIILLFYGGSYVYSSKG
jgi:hypothetical protein